VHSGAARAKAAAGRAGAGAGAGAGAQPGGGSRGSGSVEERVQEFRRKLGGSAAVVAVLGVVNAVTTPFFPWVVFPAIGFTISLANRLGSLWADGVSTGDIFGRGARGERGSRGRSAPPAGRLPAPIRGALPPPAEPLPRAAVYAERTRTELAEIVAGLPDADRQLIPDVMPTVDRLVERIRLLSVTIARLDASVAPGAAAALDARIAHAEEQGKDVRTLTLLRRQRDSLNDLLERRTVIRAQLESASLALENLRLQLVKLRSAGVQSAMDNVTSATQEAHALARDIGHVLDAASEVRALQRGEKRED
jgi:hypothetical protein